jgi:hypothetical protein
MSRVTSAVAVLRSMQGLDEAPHGALAVPKDASVFGLWPILAAAAACIARMSRCLQYCTDYRSRGDGCLMSVQVRLLYGTKMKETRLSVPPTKPLTTVN